ncbi:hypothetical protein GCM10025331_48230 [Actinoplanes utahensis]|nr:hypothetical protein Aut01nite_57410 [Actinoplanes utahensis]
MSPSPAAATWRREAGEERVKGRDELLGSQKPGRVTQTLSTVGDRSVVKNAREAREVNRSARAVLTFDVATH